MKLSKAGPCKIFGSDDWSKFAFFKRQRKSMFGHASNLLKATFDEAPEQLNTVEMSGALPELVVDVMDAIRAVNAHNPSWPRQPVVSPIAARVILS